jgi:hypothetical protein
VVDVELRHIIARNWHYPSSTGMTYPKSEIRNKDCGPLTFRETGRD